MRSAADKLAEAIEAWRRQDATERVARWRGDPDALTAAAVHARHARLQGAQAQELLEEAIDRGQLAPEDERAMVGALSQAERAPRLAAASEREKELWAARVPWDSDHHAASRLLANLETDPSDKRRRSMGRALEPTLHELGARRRELAVELGVPPSASASAPASGPAPAPASSPGPAPAPTPAPTPAPSPAERALQQTTDAWQEALARVCHAAGVPPASWTDLARALRATAWDDAVKPSERWRRLADGFGALGMPGTLARSVKIERRAAEPTARTGRLAVIEPRRDLRIGPGFERGVASERDAAEVLGRALAAGLAHAGLPWHRARPTATSMGGGLGALFAHLLADPEHLARTRSLSAAEGRRLTELHLALELAALRTAAYRVSMRPHLAEGDLGERATHALRSAWGIEECPEGLAVALAAGPDASAELAARASAGRLYVTLRERFDADFWRNPAVEEPVRSGAAQAASLERWIAELEAPEVDLSERYAELL